MMGYENAWQASNISFSKWKQNVWRQPAIFAAHYICDQSKRWLAAGRSHRFFSFSISIFFFNIFLLFCCFLKCIYFILFSFSWYGFLIIIIVILVVKIFISFVIYLLLTIKEKHFLFFLFFLSCSTNLAKFFVRMLGHHTLPMTSGIWRIFAELNNS